MAELTAKQGRFVEEYLVDLNATQAAIRAGYSEKTAHVIGCENLGKPKVAEAIQEAMAARSERTEITAERVLQELALVGFANVGDLFNWDADRACFIPKVDLTRDEMAAIGAIESEQEEIYAGRGADRESIGQVRKLKIKLHDKLSALREIGKHLGVADNVNVRAPDGIEVRTVRIPEKSQDANEWAERFRGAQKSPQPNGNGAAGR